jgi:hypothetical protein
VLKQCQNIYFYRTDTQNNNKGDDDNSPIIYLRTYTTAHRPIKKEAEAKEGKKSNIIHTNIIQNLATCGI